MKKLVLAAVLSAFSFSAAATYACDGMKGHEKSEKSDTQAKKDAQEGLDQERPEELIAYAISSTISPIGPGREGRPWGRPFAMSCRL